MWLRALGHQVRRSDRRIEKHCELEEKMRVKRAKEAACFVKTQKPWPGLESERDYLEFLVSKDKSLLKVPPLLTK